MLRPAALSFALLCCHAAACASPLPDYPFVSASGKAEQWLAPDIGELQFDVVAQRRDGALALAEVEEASAALAAQFAAAGVDAADIDAFELGKKSVAVVAQAGEELAFSTAISRHFTVRVRDLRAWPDYIAALLAHKAVDNLGVAFDRVDRAQVEQRLLLEAAQNARRTAADLAQAFGRKPGAAVAISRTPPDKLGGAFGFAGAAAETAAARTPAARGNAVPAAIQFGQTVHAVFRLK
ncbi:SIMPL domain-containing protein [Janthinobacterium fluminis]|uniref:SIMPL domain-containing protein n=1 Tax=Janthinobacterium fluminis TaxID=2987524 RepID=A0ABT5JYC3_9BURK|nr:SIMPL domain-containing protein [Janthinobacterium fluminis]MDC8757730.1 SIMPL domain-containing protein [Janthinobacterium fluminis]